MAIDQRMRILCGDGLLPGNVAMYGGWYSNNDKFMGWAMGRTGTGTEKERDS